MKKHAFILTTVLMTFCICLPVSAKNKKEVIDRNNQQIEVVVEQKVELENEQKEAPKAESKENCVVLEDEALSSKADNKKEEAKTDTNTSIVNKENVNNNDKESVEAAENAADIDVNNKEDSEEKADKIVDKTDAQAADEISDSTINKDDNKKVSLTPMAVVEEETTDIMAPATDNADSEIAVGGTYTVEKGDCLWNIAKKLYGDPLRWTEIYQANQGQIANPNLIFVGQVLVIPN